MFHKSLIFVCQEFFAQNFFDVIKGTINFDIGNKSAVLLLYFYYSGEVAVLYYSTTL